MPLVPRTVRRQVGRLRTYSSTVLVPTDIAAPPAGGDVVVEGVAAGNSGSATYSTGVPVPTAWPGGYTPVAGHLVLLAYRYGGTALTATAPSGFSDVPGLTLPFTEAGGSRGYCWYKVLAGGDAVPEFTPSGGATGGWDLVVLSGVHDTTPIGDADVGGGTDSVNLATLTGVLDGSELIAFLSARVATGTIPTSITTDADYTDRGEHATSRVTTSQNLRFETATRDISADGSYGGDTFSQVGGTSASVIGFHVEVRAAPVAGGGATVTPATIAATASVVRPLVNVAAGPAVATTTGALPQPGASVGAGPAAVAAAVALPAAGLNVGAGPAALSSVAALPQPAVNVGASPAVVPVVVALPPATPLAGGALAEPATLAAVASVIRPLVNVAAAPSVLAAVSALAGVGASAGASPAVLAALAALPRPPVNVAASPGALVTVVALPTPTVGAVTSVAPATLATVVAMPQAGVNVRAGPAVLAALVAVPQALPGQSVVLAPAAVAVVVTLPTAGVSVGAGPAAVAVLVSLPQASPVIPPPVPPPRWVEGATTASGLTEGGSSSSGLIEGALVGSGIVEGGSSL